MSVKTFVVDLKVEKRKKMKGALSDFLLAHMAETLKKNEQAILFLNKRGYATSLSCTTCGSYPSCPHCDIPYTYHAHGTPYLLCHYCSKKEIHISTCATCSSSAGFTQIGSGTQKIEEELRQHFPNARIQRVDVDTMSTKKAYDTFRTDMHEKNIDIVIGTQIIAKGFDFPNVTLVGVVQADIGLSIPDFRAHERTFQLLTQVMGRASRQGQEGVIIVQTFVPNHPALTFALQGDYEGFYEYELALRKQYAYPPFTEMIKCTFAHTSEDTAMNVVEKQEIALKEVVEKNQLQIEIMSAPAFIAKQHGKFVFHVFLKGTNPRVLVDMVKFGNGWKIDVDPMVTV